MNDLEIIRRLVDCASESQRLGEHCGCCDATTHLDHDTNEYVVDHKPDCPYAVALKRLEELDAGRGD